MQCGQFVTGYTDRDCCGSGVYIGHFTFLPKRIMTVSYLCFLFVLFSGSVVESATVVPGGAVNTSV